jgi:uncharacterized membrane protein YphA (DoxX/SURF4 family)
MNTTSTPISSKKMPWLQLIRIFVGLLFIFSGLIKANDPSGLSFKMQEFFGLWGMGGLNDYAMFFSIVVITFEIIAGVGILIGFAFKTFAYLVLLLMLFFTYLTGYAVWYEWSTGKKMACGCFGDCIPLTAQQSFWKDIILLVLVILLLVYRKHIRPLFSKTGAIVSMAVVTAVALFLQWYPLSYLPYIDCLPYKVGANIVEKMQVPEDAEEDVYETTYFYKNLQTGDRKEFSQDEMLAKNLWQDTLNWAYDTAYTVLIKEGNSIPEIIGFKLIDFEEEDQTDYLLSHPKPVFLWFVRDVSAASEENMDYIRNLSQLCDANGMEFFMLTSSSREETDKFLLKHKLELYTAVLDPTTSKTALRTNPGLMLVKKGTILGKWSSKNYPKSFTVQGNDVKLEF